MDSNKVDRACRHLIPAERAIFKARKGKYVTMEELRAVAFMADDKNKLAKAQAKLIKELREELIAVKIIANKWMPPEGSVEP